MIDSRALFSGVRKGPGQSIGLPAPCPSARRRHPLWSPQPRLCRSAACTWWAHDGGVPGCRPGAAAVREREECSWHGAKPSTSGELCKATKHLSADQQSCAVRPSRTQMAGFEDFRRRREATAIKLQPLHSELGGCKPPLVDSVNTEALRTANRKQIRHNLVGSSAGMALRFDGVPPVIAKLLRVQQIPLYFPAVLARLSRSASPLEITDSADLGGRPAVEPVLS